VLDNVSANSLEFDGILTLSVSTTGVDARSRTDELSNSAMLDTGMVRTLSPYSNRYDSCTTCNCTPLVNKNTPTTCRNRVAICRPALGLATFQCGNQSRIRDFKFGKKCFELSHISL
jgi:hypothetical protein